MKKIPLSVTGKKYAGMYEALVDDEWYDYLNQWAWSVFINHSSKTVYAARNDGSGTILMHRVIANAPDGVEIDHSDRNGLNNQSHNLRICMHSENSLNKSIMINNTSGAKGVDKYRTGKYRAQIKINGKRVHLGYFDKEEDAVSAYNDACVKYHGKFARPN